MIRMMVADMLEELGHSVAAEAGDINEAVKLAQSTDFDLAILDVNVNGKVITPVAELINARHRPFIFATGYGSSGLPEEYRDRPSLQKPFQLETLAQVINKYAEERAAGLVTRPARLKSTDASADNPVFQRPQFDPRSRGVPDTRLRWL